ncbi:sensor histidine kinase [Paenibacillus urinalis]|uniref:sensor histidine kinase n=1 Tax=Paenibacillus urinalis TaxID=521520 RepID=UPI001960FC63
MKNGNAYKRYLNKHMFVRILLIFSIISVITIVTLSYLIFVSISDMIVRRELDAQRAAMENVDRYINQQYELVQDMVRDIYRNEALSANLSTFMDRPYHEYVQNRLDELYRESPHYSTDVLRYFQDLIDKNTGIRNIVLYSSEMQFLTGFNQDKAFKQMSVNSARSYIPDAMSLESGNISIPNVWIRQALEQWDPALYSVRVPINDKQTFKNLGQLIVYMDSNRISDTLANDELKGQIVVLSANNKVMYDSEGLYYGQDYPYLSPSDSLFEDSNSETVNTDKDMYINKLASTDKGYVIVGAAPKAEIAQSYASIRDFIMMISAVCIAIAILVPGFIVYNFAKRTNRILYFTRKVKNGDLTARIEDQGEDELGQISRSFNDMMDELNLHIERVYEAEIKQKETELVALQARINPHFLYNTLEVIRMRALAQGAKDVGDMIYSLSVLFKSLVQPKKEYTLKDELEMCELYLELFRIRYKDRFRYTITAQPELSAQRVIKLTLQPIMENYIVHGLRPDRSDNLLNITVQADEDSMLAVIEDNGKGISPERLSEIKTELARTEETGQMFGLYSVHSRLRYTYGPKYGLEIESIPESGTVIRLRYPLEGETEGNDV